MGKKLKKKLKRKSLTKRILVGLGIPSIFIPGLILASILGWNWKIDLARLASQGGFYQSEVLFPKSTIVNKVIDGDTLELKNGRVIRLVGVDAPDRGEDFYQETLNYSIRFCEGKKIALEYDQYQDGKYGRILAYAWKDNKMLNLELVKRGLAKVVIYKKRKKLKYQDELLEMEERAKQKKVGIWK